MNRITPIITLNTLIKVNNIIKRNKKKLFIILCARKRNQLHQLNKTSLVETTLTPLEKKVSEIKKQKKNQLTTSLTHELVITLYKLIVRVSLTNLYGHHVRPYLTNKTVCTQKFNISWQWRYKPDFYNRFTKKKFK